MSTSRDLEISPFCTHLRSKKSYFLQRPAREESELVDASRWLWCACTMEILGPDDEPADPQDCRRGRSCFRALGAAHDPT